MGDPTADERDAVQQQVRDRLARLTHDGVTTARLDGSAHELFPVAPNSTEGAALRDWVIQLRAVNTIEVGLGYGISALYICDGLLSGGGVAPHHVVIDPHQRTRFADCGLQHLDDAGVLSMVAHYRDESQIVLPRLLSEERAFDLAFVDGNHRFDGVFLDLVYLGRLVQPQGIIFLDDYQLPAVRRAASFFVTNRGWMLEEMSRTDQHHGWAVLRTALGPDTRAFDDFVEF